VIVVDRHRIADAQVTDRAAHVGQVAFEGELRRVDADHHEALVAVLVRPGLDIGQGPQAVDAGVGPEIDHHDLAAQALGAQRR